MIHNTTISVDHKVKIKESEKIDKYYNLARELKKKHHDYPKCCIFKIGQKIEKKYWRPENTCCH